MAIDAELVIDRGQNVLRLQRSFANTDLVVVDWDAALVVDLAGGAEDVLFVLELANLQRFLLLDLLPNDLRLAMAQELTQSKRPGLMKLYAVPEVGQLLLRKM